MRLLSASESLCRGGLGALLAVFLSFSPHSALAARPNILFILADDMGWQDTSVPFGPTRTPFNERYRTPGLERLARDGGKFTQAYSCAVCSPSRVSLKSEAPC